MALLLLLGLAHFSGDIVAVLDWNIFTFLLWYVAALVLPHEVAFRHCIAITDIIRRD